jgi:hypothetical protein
MQQGRGTGLKRAVVAGLAAVLMLGIAAPSGQAAKSKKVASHVDIDGRDQQPPDFDTDLVGNVYSKQPKCVRNREVTIFREGDSEPVGTVTTDRTGDWRVTVDPNFGSFEARVAKKQVRKRGKKIVCKKDTSPTFVLPI